MHVQKERIEQLRQPFEIGKYIREQYHRNIPKYRVDFLLTLSQAGKELSLLIEYDGVEFHTRNPDLVTRFQFYHLTPSRSFAKFRLALWAVRMDARCRANSASRPRRIMRPRTFLRWLTAV